MNLRPAQSETQRAGLVVLLARGPARFDRAAALGLGLWLGACSKQPAPSPGPAGLVDNTGNSPVAAPIPTPAPVAPPPEAPTVYDFERQAPSDPGALSAPLPPSGLAPGNALGEPKAADAGGPARDLGAELSAALGPAESCVDGAQAAALPGGRLTISVSAYVLPSGRVSRATVTAPGQPQTARDCMQKQVLALSLRQPIPDAPTQVNGSTQVQVRSAGGVGATTGGNAVRPQRTNPDIAKPEPGDVAGAPE
jgi:hypothetical protein